MTTFSDLPSDTLWDDTITLHTEGVDVPTSCAVAVRNGQVRAFRRADDVWLRVRVDGAFHAIVGAALRSLAERFAIAKGQVDDMVARAETGNRRIAEVLQLRREEIARTERAEADAVTQKRRAEYAEGRWLRAEEDVARLSRESDALAALAERRADDCDAARPVCQSCGKPATCLGVYEDPAGPPEYGCDECCGHGCEDGRCYRLPGVGDPALQEGA